MGKLKYMFWGLVLLNLGFAFGMESEFKKIKLVNNLSEEEKDKLALDLVVAATKNDLDKAKKLIDAGADPNRHTNICAIVRASTKGHKDMVKLLLDNGANVNIKDDNGYTSLMMASWFNRPEILKLLLDYNAIIDLKDKRDQTALMISCQKGHKDIIELLLNYGADVHYKNKYNDTVLSVCSLLDYHEIVNLLLHYGVNISEERNGKTAARIASEESRWEMAVILSDFYKNNWDYFPKLVKAIESNNFGEIKKLLKMPTYLIDLDTGNNALHIAAQLRNLEIFKFILSLRPCLINKKNYNGKTPFDLNQEMLILLILDYQENKVENKNNN